MATYQASCFLHFHNAEVVNFVYDCMRAGNPATESLVFFVRNCVTNYSAWGATMDQCIRDKTGWGQIRYTKLQQ